MNFPLGKKIILRTILSPLRLAKFIRFPKRIYILKEYMRWEINKHATWETHENGREILNVKLGWETHKNGRENQSISPRRSISRLRLRTLALRHASTALHTPVYIKYGMPKMTHNARKTGHAQKMNAPKITGCSESW